jgi:hypothetical protein
VLIVGLPDLRDWLAGFFPKKGSSQNLLALPENCAIEQVDLLLCAHIDTARAVPSSYGARFINPLRQQVFPVMQRTTVILIILAAICLVGILPGQVVFAAAVSLAGLVGLALIGLDLWEQLGTRQQFSVGANDNASGVGVLLALAEQLCQAGPLKLKVAYLFTGAEEAGLWGARYFAQKLARAGQRPLVVCVDMVGAGDELRIMMGRKNFRLLETNSEVNEWLERGDYSAARHTAIRRSSDFEAFIQAGIPCGWVESDGTAQSWRAYHTQRDQPGLIDPDMLQKSAEMLLRMIQVMDRGKKAANTEPIER